MNTITIIAILSMSVFFTVAFVGILKSRGPWGSAWSFFTINLLWLAAVSLWIPPAGPVWYGAPWIDLFVTGLLLSFLLSATPDTSTSSPVSTDDLLDTNIKIEHTIGKNSIIHSNRSSGHLNTVESSDEVSKETITENQSATHSGVKAKAGGIFWVLLLCLCALIIIGAT